MPTDTEPSTGEPVYTLYVDIRGGSLHGIYGDLLPPGFQVNFVLRDHDIIETGGPDPLPEGYEESASYW